MSDETPAAFFIGLMIGVIASFVIIGLSLSVGESVNSVHALPQPDEIYRVLVDDIEFTCRTTPTIKDTKIKLWNCKELYGDLTVIKNFDSYSVELVK